MSAAITWGQPSWVPEWGTSWARVGVCDEPRPERCSAAQQPGSTIAERTKWQKAETHSLTPIKVSRRNFIDKWVIDT